jgi:hypothetical protein
MHVGLHSMCVADCVVGEGTRGLKCLPDSPLERLLRGLHMWLLERLPQGATQACMWITDH